MNTVETSEQNGSPLPCLEALENGTAKNDSEQIVEKVSPSQKFQGLPSNRCRRCGRALSATSSVQHGYGDVCFRKTKTGDIRQSRAMQNLNPRTITDDGLARKTMQAIYRLIARLPELQKDRGMHRMGQDILSLPLESFDAVPYTPTANHGTILPGFGKPQWFYLHTDRYDMAIWKLGISDNDILAELGLPMTPSGGASQVIAAAIHRRPVITEEPITGVQ